MSLYESIEIIGDFFRFTYIENPGMAFGLQMENKIIFTILSVVAAIIVAVYLYKMRKESFTLQIALALILGGAIGNLIDRLIYGKVIDFLDVEFFDISIPAFKFFIIDFPGYALTRWPVFNIADSSVSIGMVVITWMILFVKDKSKLGIIN
jgi:signal peptidase II